MERARQEGVTLPSLVVAAVMRMIRSSVKSRAGFSVKELKPIASAPSCFIPALFVAATDDDFIMPHHSQQIFEAYAGDKNIVTVDGDHNSQRPGYLFDSASFFLLDALQVPAECRMQPADMGAAFAMAPRSPAPPWAQPGRAWGQEMGFFPDDGQGFADELAAEAIADQRAAAAAGGGAPQRRRRRRRRRQRQRR